MYWSYDEVDDDETLQLGVGLVLVVIELDEVEVDLFIKNDILYIVDQYV